MSDAMLENNISIEKIVPTNKQIDILYQQLSLRNNKPRHNISHNSDTSFEQHAEFVNHHPYRAWFLILHKRQAIGSVYVQYDNSLGLHIFEHCQASTIEAVISILRKKIQPLKAKPSLRYGDFFLNVAYANTSMQDALLELGYRPTQVSFISPR